jgi:hypothetical protein
MANYLVAGATKLTAYFVFGAYAVLGTLFTDGTIRTRSGDVLTVDPDTVRSFTMHRGVAAADRGQWGRGIGMVRLSRMGLVGLNATEGAGKGLYVGAEDILEHHPNMRDLSDEEKDVIRDAFALAKERVQA